MALRLMGLLVALACVALCNGLIPSPFAKSFHTDLTQDVSVACKFSTNMNFTLTVFIVANSDFIGNIYMVNQTYMSQTTDKIYDLNETALVSGSGTPTDPYYISVEAYDSDNAGTYAVTPESEKKLAEFQDGILSVYVMVKSNMTLGNGGTYDPKVLFPEDVLYKASCNKTETQDYLISTGLINATGDVEEVPRDIVNMLTMEIRLRDTNMSITNIQIGEEIDLAVLNAKNNENYQLISGTYVHSLKVCDKKDCSGALTYYLLDKYGCPTTTIVPSFMQYGAKDAKAGPFEVFRLRDKESLYMVAMAGNCYKAMDVKCYDFCTYNKQKNAGRRRRDVSEPEEQETAVSAFVKIIVTGDDGDNVILPADNDAQRNQDAKQQAAVNETLLGAVIALGALFVIGLAVAIAIFYRLTKVNRKA